ncbi:MAG: hypothetical protein ACREV6_15305 [Clostridium sp.]|uniref:hypothetical protein n=1 Tax=Clostridium sp. TaxID=1506 RepID=UPI003D6D7322
MGKIVNDIKVKNGIRVVSDNANMIITLDKNSSYYADMVEKYLGIRIMDYQEMVRLEDFLHF